MTEALPVLFLHGIRTSASMWRHQLDALGRAGHPALAIDLPGHGARMGEEFTLAAVDDAIALAIEALGGRVLLVGLSLGGYLGIHFAARHPEQVAGLVAASCGTVPRAPFVGGYRALAAGIRRLPDRGRALNDMMARRFVPEPGVADLLAGGIALDVMGPALRAVGTLDPVGDLAAYPGPVWLVNGSLDHFRIDARRMLRACRDGRLVVIPRATHLVSLVRPELFTRAIELALHDLPAERLAERG